MRVVIVRTAGKIDQVSVWIFEKAGTHISLNEILIINSKRTEEILYPTIASRRNSMWFSPAIELEIKLKHPAAIKKLK